jgi:transcriptional regulator of arginine metabolism
MKNKRLDRIKELITNFDISTQDMLVEMLNADGYNVTQATVSRDIKKLGLSKSFENGVNKYVLKNDSHHNHDYLMFKNGTLSIVSAQNIVVIKCKAGLANAICVFLDELELEGLVGTLAGDDTIFLATTDNLSAQKICELLNDKII